MDTDMTKQYTHWLGVFFVRILEKKKPPRVWSGQLSVSQ